MVAAALGLVGGTLVGVVTVSAIRTVILPRAAADPLTRMVFGTLYRVFRLFSRIRDSYEHRDRIMAVFGPVSLVGLVAFWVSTTMIGYTFLFRAAGVESWRTALKTSGSSLLTLGFTPVAGSGQTLLAFSEAAIGLGVIALLITYLPTIYQSFNRRELQVGLLEVRAGSPPSGVAMLERFTFIGWLEHLPEEWAAWEEWFVDIEETHTSLPVLVFFRSPHPDRSWITAAGAALDGAALARSCIDMPPMPQADLTIRAGYVALRRIADFFGIGYDPDPAPGDPTSITRAEFDEAYDRIAAAGAPVKDDRDLAWRDYSGWRVNYDTVLLAFCALTMAPYAPWSSDRSSASWHRPPRLRRWGRFRSKAQR